MCVSAVIDALQLLLISSICQVAAERVNQLSSLYSLSIFQLSASFPPSPPPFSLRSLSSSSSVPTLGHHASLSASCSVYLLTKVTSTVFFYAQYSHLCLVFLLSKPAGKVKYCLIIRIFQKEDLN